MKGLLLNNLMSTKNNLLTLTPVLLIAMMIGIFVAPLAMFTLVVNFTIFMYPLLYISCYHHDYASNWNKLELIMPIKRGSIVLSKYLTLLIFLVSGLLLATLYATINLLIGNISWDTSIVSTFLLALSTTINAGAFFYPPVLLWGESRSESIIIFSLIASMIPLYITMLIVSRILELDHLFALYDYPLFWILYLLFTIILFIISYFISRKIYENKEF